MHVLDDPVWTALTGPHRHLAVGHGPALRYPAHIGPFAATGDDHADSVAELASLFSAGETVMLVRKAPIPLPAGFALMNTTRVVQMVATQRIELSSDQCIEQLGAADEAQIYDLAALARPGPFGRHTMRLGRFWGIKRDGRLIAMAGERFRQRDWAEVSGVCVHPDHRQQGLARRLTAHATADIAGGGEQPYLHCLDTNHAAIDLYKSIGFETRETMNLTVATRLSD